MISMIYFLCLLLPCQIFFYGLFFIVAFNLNEIIKLIDIEYSKINDMSIEFFLNFFKTLLTYCVAHVPV